MVVSHMSEDMKLRELLIRATKDVAFREKFLKMPEQTAAEMNVKIKPEQLEKTKTLVSTSTNTNQPQARLWNL